MRFFLLFIFIFAPSVTAEVIVLVDGTRMEVQRYELRGEEVLLTTPDGKLRTILRSYVNVDATERHRTAHRVPPPPRPQEAPVSRPVLRPPKLPLPAAASSPSRDAALVRGLSYELVEGLVRVTVQADGHLNYSTFELDDPKRLVFDFRGVRKQRGLSTLSIGALGVQRARIAQFRVANPPITRLVFDLETLSTYQAVQDGANFKIIFSPSVEEAPLEPRPAAHASQPVTMTDSALPPKLPLPHPHAAPNESPRSSAPPVHQTNPAAPPEGTGLPTSPPSLASTSPPSPQLWVDDDLGVSLPLPSRSWRVQERTGSAHMPLTIENSKTQARVTLGVLQAPLQDHTDYQELLGEMEASLSATPGSRPLTQGPLSLGPYTAYEFRFLKPLGRSYLYNHLVVYYSRDFAYVLNASCPEERLTENESAFESLVRGLSIRGSRNELVPNAITLTNRDGPVSSSSSTTKGPRHPAARVAGSFVDFWRRVLGNDQ